MTQPNTSTPHAEESLPHGTVLIAGGGPVGLILARVLSYYGVQSVLVERNKSTTSWPKMDLTNARSMELFRKLGLADELRQQGVPSHFDSDVLISTGLSCDKPLTKWKLPGVDKFRKRIYENNDGTQPLEPWQRLSQVVFEKWLKSICDNDPLIELRYGWKVESFQEGDDGVSITVTDVDTGAHRTITSDYVAGCDGASSAIRRSLEIPLDGGPIPACALLVHFKSRDLQRLHKQGQFWHIFLMEPSGGFGGAIIAQDEIDTWTIHLFMPLDAEPEKIDSHEAVYRVLGGVYGNYPIEIDEILVRSVWRPVIAVTRTWNSQNLRAFLAGDAAHQNIPTGGYGMNMGIADAFDLGWKLASVINGSGGNGLLKSYELERKPVALRNVERSGVHFQVHERLRELLAGGDPRRIDRDTEEGRNLRAVVHKYYEEHDGENKDFGIEMGYRYESPVIIPDNECSEPVWMPSRYTPTTWPGGRPPHIFLSDGSAIFDRFGKHWTLLSFSNEDCGQKLLIDAAHSLMIPLERVDLSHEKQAKELYERNMVLSRPDQHVAWRADSLDSTEKARYILNVVLGRIDIESSLRGEQEPAQPPAQAFTATAGTTTQTTEFEIAGMSDFQR